LAQSQSFFSCLLLVLSLVNAVSMAASAETSDCECTVTGGDWSSDPPIPPSTNALHASLSQSTPESTASIESVSDRDWGTDPLMASSSTTPRVIPIRHVRVKPDIPGSFWWGPVPKHANAQAVYVDLAGSEHPYGDNPLDALEDCITLHGTVLVVVPNDSPASALGTTPFQTWYDVIERRKLTPYVYLLTRHQYDGDLNYDVGAILHT